MTEAKDDELGSEEQKYESRFTFLDKQTTGTHCFHGEQREQFHLY